MDSENDTSIVSENNDYGRHVHYNDISTTSSNSESSEMDKCLDEALDDAEDDDFINSHFRGNGTVSGKWKMLQKIKIQQKLIILMNLNETHLNENFQLFLV